ncbi:MAG: fibronectin type III domain-containing protein [Vicinamibacterales bacterium]
MHHLRLMIALLLCPTTPAAAGSLTVAWNPNPEPTVAGYLLKYGTERGRHTVVIDTGLQTSWTIGSLVDGQRYYLVVQAYDTSGAVSPPSDEVSGMASAACIYGASPAVLSFGPDGGERQVLVSATQSCQWTAATGFPWLHLSGDTNGSGDGLLSISAARLPLAGTRVAFVQLAGLEVMVIQGVVIRQTAVTSAGAFDSRATTLWRPGQGTWYLAHGGALAEWLSKGLGNGWLDGEPVLGDYDGDGTEDIATWSHDGTWSIRTAASGLADVRQIVWGEKGDVPVPADYDGDRRTDVAVWKPDTGMWSITTSSSGYRDHFTVEWGTRSLGDQPAVGDFDGDGRADISVWRASTGGWHVLRSHLGYSRRDAFVATLGHGASGDEPVVGDFDGDGASDIAIRRGPSRDIWCVVPSARGLVPARPVVSVRSRLEIDQHLDVNGDGRSDVVLSPERQIHESLAAAQRLDPDAPAMTDSHCD